MTIAKKSHRKGKSFEQEYGLERALQIRKKMSEGRKGMKLSEEHKRNVGLSSLGHKLSGESKTKISLANKGKNNGMFGKHHSEETRKKISWAGKKRIIKSETKRKISETTKKLWQDEGYRKKHREKFEDAEFKSQWIKNTLSGLLKRPTSFEQKISNLCIKHNLPFIYKGNGGFLINFKNPDFVDEKNKTVIEVFYSWFKIRDYGSVENYKDFCKQKYNLAGWKVIFLDENEVMHNNWEEICLNKILNVMEVLNYDNKK